MDEKIIISAPEKFRAVKNKMIQDGPDKLHVLSDFDGTLTLKFVDGENIPSPLAILRDKNCITDGYGVKAQELYDKYHPIEIDPRAPLEYKKEMMREWWRQVFDLLIKSGLNRKNIEEAVISGKMRLRNGSDYFFPALKENNIPLVIMSSSGLGRDSISIFLDSRGNLSDNVHIISNIFEWDSDGNVIAVKDPIIHGMGKKEVSVKDFPVFDSIKDRRNVILLGDMIGDVEMIDGFDCENLIKIGFLEENVEESLDLYKDNYDMVILGSYSIDCVNNILREVIGE
jgi:5'-nucleotidase